MNSAEIREALASNRSNTSAERGNARIMIVKAAADYADLLDAQERGEAIVVRREGKYWVLDRDAALAAVAGSKAEVLDRYFDALAASQGSG